MKKYQGVSIVTIKGNKGDIGDPFQLKPGQVVSFPGENGSSGKDGESIIGPIGLTGKDGRDGQDAVFEIDAIVKTIIPHIKYADIKDAPQWKPGLVTDKGWAGTGYLREISDVAVSGVSNGQSIQWNSKTNKWENYTPSSVDLSAYSTKTVADTLYKPIGYTPDLSTYIPYTGATTDVNLGAHDLY